MNPELYTICEVRFEPELSVISSSSAAGSRMVGGAGITVARACGGGVFVLATLFGPPKTPFASANAAVSFSISCSA